MPELPLLISIAALTGAAFSAYGVWRRRAVSAWPRATAEVVATEVIELGSRVQNREGPEPSRIPTRRIGLTLFLLAMAGFALFIHLQ